jgi:hypothetical protein
MIATALAFLAGNWIRLALYGVVILGALGTAAGVGYHKGVKRLWDYQVEQARQAVKIVIKIEKVKEIIRVPYIKRETVIQTVFQTIEKETENATSRPACNATRGWVRRHDAAADGEDRRDGGTVDDEGDTTVTETSAQLVVVQNYRSYHQVANDLRACRAFVVGIAKLTEEP